MFTLTEYLARHRTESAPKTEDVFPGEIYRSTRALYYDVPANDKTYRVFAYLTLPQRKPPRGGFPASGNVPHAVGRLSRLWKRSPRRGETFPLLESFPASWGGFPAAGRRCVKMYWHADNAESADSRRLIQV